MLLGHLDLNLLKALHALITTRSVSLAAEKLHVTQPAVSHSLKRLREIFDDPLLVREGRDMRLSPAAQRFEEPLALLIAGCEALFNAGRTFDPQRDRRVFRIAMSDVMTLECLPRLVTRLRNEAPNVDIVVERGGPQHSCQMLVNDQIDLALGVFPAVPPGLHTMNLYRDELVCIADKSNPHLRRGKLSLQSFLDSPHVTMAQSSDTGIQLDDILRSLGLQRRIVVTVPHYLAIPATIAGTDLIAHTRRKLLKMLRLNNNLVILPIPVPVLVPDLIFSMVWHPRQQLDAAHVWLRAFVTKSLHSLT